MTDIITADGYPKLVYVFNNSLPGPALHLYQNQTIRVRIYNDFQTESLSVHFHGIRQVGTPTSDGVGRVTQLSILPGSSFLHEFIAVDEGTFWYHSHVSSQTAMGLLGGFIVHPKTISTYGEFVLVLNDWQHFYTSQQHLLLVESGQFYPNSLESLTQSDTIDYFESVDGSRAAEALVTSILINGRGQYFDPRATNDNSSTTPLEILNISDSNYSTYRLRLINGGSVFSLKFSIDEHPLQVIASDGVPFTEPLIVDQLIIGLGERFDVLINRKIMNSVNYWIRVDTMDKNNNPRWYARAILQYTHESRMPTTSQKNCTVLEQCRILNCPFSQYGSEPSFICLTPQNMSTHTDYLDLDLLNETINVNVKRTLSLNMVMGNEDRAGFESINYIGMQYPSMQEPILYNAQTARYLLPCSNSRLDMNTGERCYHFILAQFGDIIEFLLINYDTHQHPMHLHGSYFHIVEQGLAQLNTTTGEFLDNNPNVECNDYAECVCKAGSTCTKNNMRLIKDTVQVPKGGFMRIRFRATNPGVWLFHCHTEPHLDRGMAVMLHIAEDHIRLSTSSSTTIMSNSIILIATILYFQQLIEFIKLTY
ncbi:unnamed protein product [Rotaria sp. Silwood2]|nr:unnamed protein product [Rotaria sp. Silwood2]CAF4131705.1 unnamed protein product [Rotaria sp. Silwood2]